MKNEEFRENHPALREFLQQHAWNSRGVRRKSQRLHAQNNALTGVRRP